MKRYTFQEIKEFVSKPLFDEKIILKKNSDYPKISIITPSYNQAEFLERTILSILNQNYPNLEYIIIDGGSTDGSVEIIKKYEKYLAYWVSEKDKGQSAAINKGFKRSTGKIIAWQNSDDIYFPGVFKYIAKLFNKKKCEIIMGDIILITREDKPIRTLRYGPWPKFGLKNVGMLIANQSAFWTRELHIKCMPIEENLHYDFDEDFFYRLVIQAKRIKHVPKVFGCFRFHSAAKANNIKKYQEEKNIVQLTHNLQRGNIFFSFIEKIIRAIYCLIKGNILYLVSPKKDAERIMNIDIW